MFTGGGSVDRSEVWAKRQGHEEIEHDVPLQQD